MKIQIKYTGKKAIEVDPYLFLEWKPGTIHDVEEEQAAWLLFHNDSFADARTAASQKKHPVVAKERPRLYAFKEETPPLANLQLMEAPALQQYAVRNFNERLPDTMPPPEMRSRIMGLMSRSMF
jgi:hypothetical protein